VEGYYLVEIVILIGAFFMLMLLGVPIAFSMGISSVIFLIFFYLTGGSIPMETAVQRIVLAVNSFPFLAIPLFVLAGELMNTGGITRRIIDFSNALVGHFRGGLAQVNILASIFFSGMSGSSIADSATIGKIMIPQMINEKYDRGFSAVVTASSSTIGPIIPPSIIMVIYGVMSGTSIGRLFIGGIIPGLLMGLSLMVITYIISKQKNYPVHHRASYKMMIKSFAKSFFPLLMPFLLIWGILSGQFTPTEAAVVAVVYGLILCVFYRELKISDLPHIGSCVVKTSARILFIISAAGLFGWLLTYLNAPSMFADYLISISGNVIMTIILINIILLVLGFFIETTAIIIMTVPVLMPVVMELGMDPVQFGVMMLLNCMIGTITFPVGVLMFVVNDIAGINTYEFVKSAKYFYLALLIVLMMLAFIPQITTFLPSLLMP
jgi:tripartite ATP-independent transporter DctM subunit